MDKHKNSLENFDVKVSLKETAYRFVKLLTSNHSYGNILQLQDRSPDYFLTKLIQPFISKGSLAFRIDVVDKHVLDRLKSFSILVATSEAIIVTGFVLAEPKVS